MRIRWAAVAGLALAVVGVGLMVATDPMNPTGLVLVGAVLAAGGLVLYNLRRA